MVFNNWYLYGIYGIYIYHMVFNNYVQLLHIVVKYSIHTCHIPSTADTGCSIIGSARSTTVEYRTDSRLLHTFIGLNHVIRLANLLQHLR